MAHQYKQTAWVPMEGEEGQQQWAERGSGSGNASGGDGGGDDIDRPSFSEYWKGERESGTMAGVQFVNEVQLPRRTPSSSPPLSSLGMSPPPQMQPQIQLQQGSLDSKAVSADKAKEKAKLRRQQVRKAQIQHRTRKANYIKQLELDVCKFRDMIATTEKELLAYWRENESMRDALKARGLRIPSEAKGKEVLVGEVCIVDEPPVEELHAHEEQQSLPGPIDAHPDQGRSSAPDPQQTYQPQLVDYDPYPPADLFANISMDGITVTMRKDEILGTPCFQISSPSSTSISPNPLRPATPAQLSPEQELIAVNLILAMEHICWNHFHPRQFPNHGDPCKAASGHTMMASTMCMSSAPERVYRAIRRREAESATVVHTWQASTGAGSSLSLKSLLSLARTLNPSDIELTPVQAWFELAARYGPAALLEDHVIEALKRELCGVVDCIHFGAIIERDAFESVVARVMSEAGVAELEYEMDVDNAGAATGMELARGVGQIAA